LIINNIKLKILKINYFEAIFIHNLSTKLAETQSVNLSQPNSTPASYFAFFGG